MSGSLNRRVEKLEAVEHERSTAPCRWCANVWVYPDQFPLVDGVRPPMPRCERRETGACSGFLLIEITGDEEEALATEPA